MIPIAFTAINTAVAATGTLNKITTTAETIRKGGEGVAKGLHALAAQGSYSDVTQLSRAEFLTLVDSDCMNIEFLPEVTQTVLSISTGYYLQALAVLGNVHSAKLISTLSRLKPGGNDTKLFSMENEALVHNTKNDGQHKMSLESYKWKLPMSNTKQPSEIKYALEANDGGSAAASIRDNVNLAIGRIIDVKVDTEKGPVTMPITFRLNVKSVPSKQMVSLLSMGKVTNTFTERFHAWRSGEIEFVKDFLLCTDMIKERKKLMIGDKFGGVSALMARANRPERLFGLIGKNPDLGAATAVFILSSATAKDLERAIVGNLDDYKVRQRIFEAGHMLLLVVIDKQFEEITFYHRGIAESSTMRLRDIKMSNKDSGPSVTDIMAALINGQTPKF